MSKVKVCTLSNTKINQICKEAENCDKCPLSRKNEKGMKLMCYRRCRALYFLNKHYYEDLLSKDLKQSEREYHEAMWEQTKLDQLKLEQEEIEL